jgi:hypothetical protein
VPGREFAWPVPVARAYDALLMQPRHSSNVHLAPWHRDPRAGQLVLVGLVLLASGLVHAGVWAVLGGPWEGPVTWRKPILFGISAGLTSLSAGWTVRSRVWLVAVATVATAAVLAYALGQTLTGRGRFEFGTAVVHQMPTIMFDLDRLDADGLAGPPDGKVAISYEFRIPDTPENRAAVKAIDPTIEIMSGPPGRVDAGPGFALCIGSTCQPRHREILLALAGLPFVERIQECVFER